MLSQTSEYALRAMTCLAFSNARLTTTPSLAEMTKVPSNYLAKVLQSLAQAELIIGRRGVGGGYRLARPANEITILDIVNAIDPVDRVHSGPSELASQGAGLRPLYRVLDAASKDVIERFGSTSLHDLVTDPTAGTPLPEAKPESTQRAKSDPTNGSNSGLTLSA